MPKDKKSSKAAAAENIRVAIRLRDLLPHELQRGDKPTARISPADRQIIIQKDFAEEQGFTFDAVFDNRSSQQDLFLQEVQPLCESVLEGYNATVFAYGQSGTGKTYTMTGDVSNRRHWGMLPQVLDHLLRETKKLSSSTKVVKLMVNYLEIYLGDVSDLLVPAKQSKKLAVRLNSHGNFHVPELTSHEVTCEEDCFKLFEFGTGNRTVAATDMNGQSSRSHALFSFNVEQYDYEKDPKNPVVVSSKITIVDLAGSERLDRTGAEGITMKQGIKINSELTQLAFVIDSLVKGNRATFRTTALTMLLKDSIGGNAKTVLFATIGPSSKDAPESLSTINFALGAKKIKNKPVKNIDPKDALIQELSEKVAELQKKLDGEMPVTAEMDSEEVARLQVQLAEATSSLDSVLRDLDEERRKSAALATEMQQHTENAEKNILMFGEKNLILDSKLAELQEEHASLLMTATHVLEKGCQSNEQAFPYITSQHPEVTCEKNEETGVFTAPQLCKFLPTYAFLQEKWLQELRNTVAERAAIPEVDKTALTDLRADNDALKEMLAAANAKAAESAAVQVELRALQAENEKLHGKLAKDQAKYKAKIAKVQEEATEQLSQALATAKRVDTPEKLSEEGMTNLDFAQIHADVDSELVQELKAQIQLRHQLNKIEHLRQQKLEAMLVQYNRLKNSQGRRDALLVVKGEEQDGQKGEEERGLDCIGKDKAFVEAEGRIHTLLKELNSIKNTTSNLSMESAALQDECSELKAMNADLTKHNFEMVGKIEALNQEMEKLRQERSAFSEKVDRRNKKLEAMFKELEASKQEAVAGKSEAGQWQLQAKQAEGMLSSAQRSLAANKELAERAHELLEAERTTAKLLGAKLARLQEDMREVDAIWKDRMEDQADKLIASHNSRIQELAAAHQHILDEKDTKNNKLKKKLRDANEKLEKAFQRHDEFVFENENLQNQLEKVREDALRAHRDQEKVALDSQRNYIRQIIPQKQNFM